jgi:pimeloyl-ACP methyl ester carboxylesterase
VFVHGLLVNADLWRHEVPLLAEAGFRCLAPDWPLGAHELPMDAGADLTPPGLAALIEEFLQALDLTDVTLVANDTGGALVQVLMARRPERVGRVVLVSCDALEAFFPAPFKQMAKLAHVPGALWLIAQSVRFRFLHRLPLVFGLVALHAWFGAFLYGCIGTLWGNLAEKAYDARMRCPARSWLMGGRFAEKGYWIRFQKVCAAVALPIVVLGYGIALRQVLRQ